MIMKINTPNQMCFIAVCLMAPSEVDSTIAKLNEMWLEERYQRRHAGQILCLKFLEHPDHDTRFKHIYVSGRLKAKIKRYNKDSK